MGLRAHAPNYRVGGPPPRQVPRRATAQGATRCPQLFNSHCRARRCQPGGAAGPRSVAYSSHIHPSCGAVTGPGSPGRSCFGRDLRGHHVGCPRYTDVSPAQHGPVQRGRLAATQGGEKDPVSRVRGDVGASGGHLVRGRDLVRCRTRPTLPKQASCQ